MKKFILRTLVTFSILFVFYFLITMVLEYKNKDFLKENVDVEVTIDDNGEILIPNTPGKVQANYEFSIFYFFSGILVSVSVPILFYKYGGIKIIKDRNIKYKIFEGGVLYIFYTIFSYIIVFPKIFFSSFYRGRLVGIKSYSFIEFLKKYFFGDVISFVLSIIVISIIYYVFITKKRWYIIVGAISILIIVGSSYLYPIIDEMENDLYVMQSSELKTKILDLSKKANIDDLDIRVLKMSNETSSINAYMTGVGSTKRIVFWDTLLYGMDENEVLAVTAHEMGHYKLNHILKSMVISIGEIIILCLLIHLIMKKFKGNEYNKLDYVAHILFIMSVFSIISAPLENWYSRKIEIEADTFAIELTEDPYTSGAIEIEFINSNLSPIDVNVIYKWFAYDHPTLKERVELSNRYISKIRKGE